jgi:tRNA 5-methylaminomethyl-2-thiouridine biosynthesis bifunctional protein
MSINHQTYKPISTANVDFTPNGGLQSLIFDDMYYQEASAVGESHHVFCEGNHLAERFNALDPNKKGLFLIGEVGFGTGLNFLNVMRLWCEHAPYSWQLHFLSAEKHPLLKKDLDKALSFYPELSNEKARLVAAYPILTPGFHRIDFNKISLTLMLGDALAMFDALLPTNHLDLAANIKSFSVDAWFLDGFSPKKNQSCWGANLFKTIGALSRKDTTLSTFSVAKEVRENLVKAGFNLEKAPGFGKKREMLKARYIEKKDEKAQKKGIRYQTPWAHSFIQPSRNKCVIVIGAGLAGCGIAFSLAKRGYQVIVLEKENAIARGASGNQAGILDIKLSHSHSPLSDFSLNAFLYAVRFYKDLGVNSNQGLLRLSDSKKESGYQSKLKGLLSAYPFLAQYQTIKELNLLAGLDLNKPGLFIPGAGLLYPRDICKRLLQHPNIHLELNHDVQEIKSREGAWCSEPFEADTLVFANSLGVLSFEDSATLSMSAYPGEVIYLKETAHSKALKIPLSGQGYLTPSIDGEHVMGGNDMLSHLVAINAADFVSKRQGVRAKTPDYLPLIGPLPIVKKMRERFALLSKDSNHFISKSGCYHQNAYVIAGFGSHALTTMPLCSEILASIINREPLPVSRDVFQSLSPSRFLIRELFKRKKPL